MTAPASARATNAPAAPRRRASSWTSSTRCSHGRGAPGRTHSEAGRSAVSTCATTRSGTRRTWPGSCWCTRHRRAGSWRRRWIRSPRHSRRCTPRRGAGARGRWRPRVEARRHPHARTGRARRNRRSVLARRAEARHEEVVERLARPRQVLRARDRDRSAAVRARRDQAGRDGGAAWCSSAFVGASPMGRLRGTCLKPTA
jgi:hypothetical protein